MTRRAALVVSAMLGVTAALAACSSTTTTSTGTSAPPATVPATAAPKGTTPGSTPGTTPGTAKPYGTTKTNGTAVAAGVVGIKVVTTPYGKALGGGNGKVLYAWDQESGTDAKCTADACVEKWPPYTGSELKVDDGIDTSMFTLVDRPDGTKQVAVNGKRLYFMAIDEPGEANCQGVDGWYIRNVDGSRNANETESKGPRA